MSQFEVLLGNKAQKQLMSLEPEIRVRVEELFKALEHTTVPFREYDLKKMAGSQNAYRVRLSGHCVLYEVIPSERKIKVTKIERRSDNTYN